MAEADRMTPSLPPPDEVALVLQGGGALGAFQVGVYEALTEAGIVPDWVAGISIGAVNAALIAGNPPEKRAAALHAFWDEVSSWLPSFPIWESPDMRDWLHQWSAGFVALGGVPGFFGPRWTNPWMASPGDPGALSYYDTTLLRQTLDRLIDWDLLNSGAMRLSVGAVQVDTGDLHYFDTADGQPLDARHIMASGALPPGLPPVEIDGKLWWDGGLVSNTPLSYVLDNQLREMLVFQVDLFPAANPMLPKTIADVAARAKEIQFSSRTRQVSKSLLVLRHEREEIRKVIAKLPAALAADPDVAALAELAEEYPVSLVHLIYRANAWEGGSRDYEFSARTVAEHIAAGRAAVAETISNSGQLTSNMLDGKTASYDLVHK